MDVYPYIEKVLTAVARSPEALDAVLAELPIGLDRNEKPADEWNLMLLGMAPLLRHAPVQTVVRLLQVFPTNTRRRFKEFMAQLGPEFTDEGRARYAEVLRAYIKAVGSQEVRERLSMGRFPLTARHQIIADAVLLECELERARPAQSGHIATAGL